jgi:hypothetical protein
MSTALKCRAKNPALCVDPACPEKRNSYTNLHDEFEARINLLNAGIPEIDISTLEAFRGTGFQKSKKNQVLQPLTGETLRLQISKCASDVFEENDDLVILRHGSVSQAPLTFADMADGTKAVGNCWSLTTDLIERIHPSELGGEEIDMVSLKTEKEYHTAVMIMANEKEWVVDYTARQFDPQLPFPYVAPISDWEKKISGFMGNEAVLFIGPYSDEDDFDELEPDYDTGIY